MNQVAIIEADSTEQYRITADLFAEYASSLDFDLSFQNFDDELKNLPGDYRAPDGCILLAFVAGDPAGCVALRSLDSDVCEMKRLYIKPQFRGKGIGRALVQKIIELASAKNYKKMRLDTISSMEAAIKLYQMMGFKKISPYRHMSVIY